MLLRLIFRRNEVGGQHLLHWQTKEGGEGKADDNRNLKQSRKTSDLRHSRSVSGRKSMIRMGVHTDKKARARSRPIGWIARIPRRRLQTRWQSAKSETKRRIGTRQGSNVSCAAKCDPCAYEGQEIMSNENDEGNTDACPADSQHQEGKRLKSNQASEDGRDEIWIADIGNFRGHACGTTIKL
jgi:hypothetical protein